MTPEVIVLLAVNNVVLHLLVTCSTTVWLIRVDVIFIM